MKKLVVSFSAFAILLLTSCGPYQTLVYTPAIEQSTSKNIAVTVDIEDLRKDKDEIGTSVSHDYGTRTILTQDDVSDWIKNALKEELTLAGYRVKEDGEYLSLNFGNPTYQIKGRLIRLASKRNVDKMVKEGKIVLELEVLKNNHKFFKKEYISRCLPKTDWSIFTFSDPFVNMLDELMQDISVDFLNDFEQKIAH